MLGELSLSIPLKELNGQDFINNWLDMVAALVRNLGDWMEPKHRENTEEEYLR